MFLGTPNSPRCSIQQGRQANKFYLLFENAVQVRVKRWLVPTYQLVVTASIQLVVTPNWVYRDRLEGHKHGIYNLTTPVSPLASSSLLLSV